MADRFKTKQLYELLSRAESSLFQKTVKITKYYSNILIFFCFLFSYISVAQDNTPLIQLGEKNIALNTPFAITVLIKTTPETPMPVCKFPEIKGFSKRNFSKTIARSVVAGQQVMTYTLVQNYLASKEGTYKLPTLKLMVDEWELKTEPCVVTVSKPVEVSGENLTEEAPLDFSELIDEQNKEALPLKDNAFLSLSTNKTTPYVGESFTLTLAFYVAENNATDLQFHQNDVQIPALIKRLKPQSCWEENFGLTEPQIATVKINGRNYTQYKYYQATFYPLNAKAIVLPSVSLRLMKDANADKAKASFISFSSKSITIQPKELPAHPLKQQISVGTFSMKENISQTNSQTGKSIDYQLQISGDGNISEIRLPDTKNDSIFDFFQPDINTTTSPQGNKIIGTKSYTFHIIPKQAGNFAMAKYFQWIYFNTQTGKYDTLVPKASIRISGKTINTVDTPMPDNVSVFEGLDKIVTAEETSDIIKVLKDEANIFIVIMLIGMMYVFLPVSKKK